MSEVEAWQQVSGPPVARSEDRQGNGSAFNQFCRRNALWPRAISGWDPRSEAEKFVPYMPVRNVTPNYPPTLLVHGTRDSDVPYAQSLMMADSLKARGVTHELIPIPEAEHGLRGGDPKLIDAAYRSALAFVDRYMKPAP